MANETSNEDMMVAIRNKIKKIIESDPNLSNLKKVYKGTPNSVPNYPAVEIDWIEDTAQQTHKGQYKITQNHQMSIIVLNKYLDYSERQDELLTITGIIKKLMVTNRYLNGLRAEDDSWRHQDIKLVGTIFEALVRPKTFVLDSSEIKLIIVTEGI